MDGWQMSAHLCVRRLGLLCGGCSFVWFLGLLLVLDCFARG